MPTHHRPTVARVADAIRAHGYDPDDFSIVPEDSIPADGTDKVPRALRNDPMVTRFKEVTQMTLLARSPNPQKTKAPAKAKE